MGVGAAIGSSWVPRAIPKVGLAAGFAVGLAAPIVAGWYLSPFGPLSVIAVLLVGALGVASGRLFGPRMTGGRFALVAVLLTLLCRLILR
jgi:hypothetical protein